MSFKSANPRLILRTSALVGLAVLVMPAVAWAGGDATFDASKGLLWLYAASFGVGFVTSLTPCVYPMIPIVIGVFGARDEKVSRKQAFLLATSYVFGMGVMYSSLGVVVALLNKQFGTFLADPRFVIPIVAFYVILAASMFGAFELALPQSMQSRLNKVGGKGYGGAFGMGLVGGLTAAPCTGPFLLGILGFVAKSGSNVAVGASMLFVYAMGMGVLFWLIAAFAVAVPKSGRWMEWVKSFGGIALLGVGIYFLRPIIPALRKATDPGMAFLLGSIVVGAIGLALGAIHLSFHDRAAIKARKGLAVVLTVVGITGVVNWSLTPPSVLPWQHDEVVAFDMAKQSDRGVMIDFSAEWCLPCKELETKTFSAFEVRERVTDGFVPLKFDVTEDSDEDEELKERYDAENLPAVIFLDAEGKELGRVNKFLPPDEFISAMDKMQAPRQASR